MLLFANRDAERKELEDMGNCIDTTWRMSIGRFRGIHRP